MLRCQRRGLPDLWRASLNGGGNALGIVVHFDLRFFSQQSSCGLPCVEAASNANYYRQVEALVHKVHKPEPYGVIHIMVNLGYWHSLETRWWA